MKHILALFFIGVSLLSARVALAADEVKVYVFEVEVGTAASHDDAKKAFGKQQTFEVYCGQYGSVIKSDKYGTFGSNQRKEDRAQQQVVGYIVKKGNSHVFSFSDADVHKVCALHAPQDIVVTDAQLVGRWPFRVKKKTLSYQVKVRTHFARFKEKSLVWGPYKPNQKVTVPLTLTHGVLGRYRENLDVKFKWAAMDVGAVSTSVKNAYDIISLKMDPADNKVKVVVNDKPGANKKACVAITFKYLTKFTWQGVRPGKVKAHFTFVKPLDNPPPRTVAIITAAERHALDKSKFGTVTAYFPPKPQRSNQKDGPRRKRTLMLGTDPEVVLTSVASDESIED